jgi:hypothetical protein
VHAERARTGNSSEAKGMLVDLSGEGVSQFLTISRLPEGGKLFTIRVNVLFQENTADYKSGSVGDLDRLGTLLRAYGKERIQLSFIDDAGVSPTVGELHVERVSAVMAYLALSDATSPEDD